MIKKILGAIAAGAILLVIFGVIEAFFSDDGGTQKEADMLANLEGNLVSLDCLVTTDVGSNAAPKFDIDLDLQTAEQYGFPAENVVFTPSSITFVSNLGFEQSIVISRSDLTLTTSSRVGDRLVEAQGVCKIVERGVKKTMGRVLDDMQLTDRTFYSSELTSRRNYPFSDLVVIGKTVYLSGIVGTDERGSLVDGGIRAQTHAIFRQLKDHLTTQNLGLKDVVKCLVMLDDIDQWSQFNKVYSDYFKPPYPARSALGADSLALGASAEMECIAVAP